MSIFFSPRNIYIAQPFQKNNNSLSLQLWLFECILFRLPTKCQLNWKDKVQPYPPNQKQKIETINLVTFRLLKWRGLLESFFYLSYILSTNLLWHLCSSQIFESNRIYGLKVVIWLKWHNSRQNFCPFCGKQGFKKWNKYSTTTSSWHKITQQIKNNNPTTLQAMYCYQSSIVISPFSSTLNKRTKQS